MRVTGPAALLTDDAGAIAGTRSRCRTTECADAEGVGKATLDDLRRRWPIGNIVAGRRTTGSRYNDARSSQARARTHCGRGDAHADRETLRRHRPLAVKSHRDAGDKVSIHSTVCRRNGTVAATPATLVADGVKQPTCVSAYSTRSTNRLVRWVRPLGGRRRSATINPFAGITTTQARADLHAGVRPRTGHAWCWSTL